MRKKAFTLIELLMVVGVLAVISAVVVLVLNPEQLISQGRDSRRVSDMDILSRAVELSEVFGGSINNAQANTVYVSLPDTDSDDLCNEYSLPSLLSGWEYNCLAPSSDLRKVDGTGWLPIDFTPIPNSKIPLSALPIDPVNNQSNFYAFTDDGALAVKLNSDKYVSFAEDDGGNSDEYYETRPISWIIPSSGLVTIKSASLPSAREFAPCARNSSTNKIYCFGGNISGSPWQLTQITEYTPATDSLIVKSAVLPFRLAEFSCAENSATNKIYCFGGGNPGYSSQIWEYTSSTDTLVTKSASLPSIRGLISCAENSATHKIYCFGGYTLPPASLDEIIEYTPATDTVVTKSAVLPSARRHLSCAEDSSTNKIYCFGGAATLALDQIVEYTPATDTVVTKSAVLPSPRWRSSCAENSSNHKIYCLGGSGSFQTYLDQIVEYNPTTDNLAVKTVVLPSPREGASCAENLATNAIYCFGGGQNGGATYLTQIIEYIVP